MDRERERERERDRETEVFERQGLHSSCSSGKSLSSTARFSFDASLGRPPWEVALIV